MPNTTARGKGLYAESLQVLNDAETWANRRPGRSGAVLRDWLAGVPSRPGDDSHLLPEDACLGQAVAELRRVSQRLARVASLLQDAARSTGELERGPRSRQ